MKYGWVGTWWSPLLGSCFTKTILTKLVHCSYFFLLRVWVLSCIWLFVTLRTVACQAPLSMELSRQKYWSNNHFLLQRGSSQLRDWTQVSCIAQVDSLPPHLLGSLLYTENRSNTGAPGLSWVRICLCLGEWTLQIPVHGVVATHWVVPSGLPQCSISTPLRSTALVTRMRMQRATV